MTRDEVLEQAAAAVLESGRRLEDDLGAHCAYGDIHADAIRALKSKHPEKSPEVETLESIRTERNALRAEVSRLKWEADGAGMLGEQSMCRREDHLPPHTPRPGDSCFVAPKK